MKNEILKTWEKFDERSKEILQIILVLGGLAGIIGFDIALEDQKDAEIDALCGQDRSTCTLIVGPMTCGSGGACGREEKWELKSPEGKKSKTSLKGKV